VVRGTVKRLSEKGYGFITPEHGDEDIFVHYTDIEGRRPKGSGVSREARE
jgi:cold shock protein